jgi:hypothetical protein
VFERFSEQARQVVVLAQEEAGILGHSYIGTEHILLGLLREKNGLAARVLGSLDVGVERTRRAVVDIVGSGEEVTSGQIPFTPRAKKVLELSLREALSLGHNHIGTEHILLGLVRENEGVATRILASFGADSETVREEVLRNFAAPRTRRSVGRVAASGRPPNPLRPPLDWERAGILWRPDRVLRGAVRELERLASRVLERELGLRVSRTRPHPIRRPTLPAPTGPALLPIPQTMRTRARTMPQPAEGLAWAAASLLWRPEGLELRVPLRLSEGALAAFASDSVWETPPLTGLRREIWNGWLAIASPTLLDDVDPEALRRGLDGAAARAVDTSNAEPERVRVFLRRLRE